jgi:hypothetical protein
MWMQVLSEKHPELLNFHKDFASLELAAKILDLTQFDNFGYWQSMIHQLISKRTIGLMQIQLKSLAEEMQAINKGLEKVEQELTISENDGPVSETFRKVTTTVVFSLFFRICFKGFDFTLF